MIFYKGKLYQSFFCRECNVERPTEKSETPNVVKCLICNCEFSVTT